MAAVSRKTPRKRFNIEEQVPVDGRTPRQYRKALSVHFNEENEKIAYILATLFKSFGRISSGKEMDIAEQMRATNRPGTAGLSNYAINRKTLKTLYTATLAHMKRQRMFVAGALGRKSRGGGGESLSSPVILKDGMYNFLLSATATADPANNVPEGPLSALRDALTFLNPASPDYRITTRDILSTLLFVYRLLANGGAGLERVGQGKSILKADARMAAFLAPYFTQLATVQRAKMQAAGATEGALKRAIPQTLTKKKTQRKVKDTDRWRIDTLEAFYHNSLTSSIMALGTYSSRNMAEARDSPSNDEKSAYARMFPVNPADTVFPRLADDEKKAYRRVFREYATQAEAARVAAKDVQVAAPNGNDLIAKVQAETGHAATPALTARIARDILTINLKNFYKAAKAARRPQSAGQISPAKYWKDRA